VILTLDLGTSATKAVLWSGEGPIGIGRGAVTTRHPEPDRAEQDPADWWSSVVDSAAATRAMAGDRAWRDVEAIAFSAARETFVPVNGAGDPIGPALLWSDRRAGTGTTLAKLGWLAAHEPERLRDADWVLAPRDLMVMRMTGAVVTDPTLASRSGCYAPDGDTPVDAAAAFAHLLPPIRASTDVAGRLLAGAASALGLPAGLPVVLGAGDRACEVLGTGATPAMPMVSWGTTASVSVPFDTTPGAPPKGFIVTAGALGGHVLEAGLSAAGSAVEWLGRLTGRTVVELADAAATSPPGARGVVALPWLNGARAPWWQPGARASFANLTAAHGPADLARSLWEAVADDVARCLGALGPSIDGVVAAGGGTAGALWLEILAAAAGGPVVLRRSGEAASAGACRIAAVALARPDDYQLESINPITARVRPDEDLVARYRIRRPLADRVAETMLRLDLSEWNV
jgi:sugar (pentulose or hexulose) kinase